MKTIKYITLVIIVLTGLSNTIFGQSNTMYYLNTMPQSYYVNPANQPKCGIFIGAPFTQNTTLLNTGFSPTDLFWYDATIDSVVNPLHSNADLRKFLGKLNPTESVNFDEQLHFLSFGFRVKNMYFCFDATLNSSNHISYPKSLVEFALLGNTNNTTYDFSSLSFESLNYMEMAFNISRNFGDMLTVGIRPKILYGLGTIGTQDNNITLETSTEDWVLNAQSTTHLAVTGLTIPVDQDGLFAPDSTFDFDSTLSFSKVINTMNKNRGFGVDLGVNFRPIQMIELSASLIDVGYINWTDKPQSIILNGKYTFNGIDLNMLDSNDVIKPILDTIKNNLNIAGSKDPFKTYLTPKLYVGGRVFLTPGVDVGLLSKTEFYSEKINQDLILLADLHPSKNFGLSLSYSLLGKGHSSFGIGWGVRVGPFNSYFISEYNPFRYDKLVNQNGEFQGIVPVDMYGLSIRVGANLVFGCNKEKHLAKDRPMFNSTNWMF